MTRLYLLAEGQTEETFVRELLAPHYAPLGLFITPIIVRTSPGHTGGVTSYGKVRNQVVRLCRQDTTASVSTLMDLYALPGDFPGKADEAYPVNGAGWQKAEFLEARLMTDINEPNFFPYLMVHEFEAVLFVLPEKFADWTDSPKVVKALTAISRAHQTPEDIDDNPLTAPSKRILKVMPSYEKTFHGPLIATEIGLDLVRQACPHFNSWLLRLDQFVM
jgi:hypothetical protein